MDELSSVEFRKRYAKLTEATVVTVNGHRIGTWTPMGAAVWESLRSAPGFVEGMDRAGQDMAAGRSAPFVHTTPKPVHVAPLRTFTPVPKPGKKG